MFNRSVQLCQVGHMTDNSNIYCLQNLMVNLAFACGLSLFYKKSFSKGNIAVVAALLGSKITSVILDSRPNLSPFVQLVGYFLILSLNLRKIVQNLGWNVLIFFIIVMESESKIINIPFFLRLLIFTVPQFIRNPSWLKAKLQPIRALFGPLYILCILYHSPASIHLGHLYLKDVALVLSAIAGTLFRPDNNALLSFMGIPYQFEKRRKLHKYFMISSLIVSFIVVVSEKSFL